MTQSGPQDGRPLLLGRQAYGRTRLMLLGALAALQRGEHVLWVCPDQQAADAASSRLRPMLQAEGATAAELGRLRFWAP